MSKNGKYIYNEVGVVAVGKKSRTKLFNAVFVEQSRFGCAEVVRLRAERGVGPRRRIDPKVVNNFTATKRKS